MNSYGDKKNEIIEYTIKYVKEFFANDISGHDFSHTMRVYKMAVYLAKQENADFFIVQMSSLLHDVDDYKISPQTSNTNSNALIFMYSQGLPNEFIKKVIRIIAEIPFKGVDTIVPKSIEGKCVQDADWLDAIGAIGIARAFAFGASKNRIFYDPNQECNCNMTEDEYKKNVSPPINHCVEKLLCLKTMMNTKTARDMAIRRDAVMREFINEFLLEWNEDFV